jgi:LmbE family N-acetylglucosaminyl deacetylase
MLKRVNLATLSGIVLISAIAIECNVKSARAQDASGARLDPYTSNDRATDARFKADILVVVAHPDDETIVSSYLAREVFDHHRRVAVVYGTRGDGGNNEVGPEQALAMGHVREIEGRQALASLGISNVWFLTGRDTASQNVLYSLENWGHGACLNDLVRIVRLTRPSVILTMLPDFTTGENHGDHQAAGVLATEAFDLAGDPAQFPEQVSPVLNPDANMNLTEGLRPWQPQKIYYFHNPTHDIFSDRGPQYPSTEISPSRGMSYSVLAAQAFTHHRTQGGDKVQLALNEHTLDSTTDPDAKLLTEPVKLILGKSLVPSGTTDDVFAGVASDGMPFQPIIRPRTSPPVEPVLEIGDPWNYYRAFWNAHALESLVNVVPLEITVKVGGALAVPLIIENPLRTAITANIDVKAPEGWDVKPVNPVSVEPHGKYFLRVQAATPKIKRDGWEDFVISAQSSNKSIGTVNVRVELSTGWVAPQ